MKLYYRCSNYSKYLENIKLPNFMMKCGMLSQFLVTYLNFLYSKYLVTCGHHLINSKAQINIQVRQKNEIRLHNFYP